MRDKQVRVRKETDEVIKELQEELPGDSTKRGIVEEAINEYKEKYLESKS